jgi:hypothetical protein
MRALGLVNRTVGEINEMRHEFGAAVHRQRLPCRN